MKTIASFLFLWVVGVNCTLAQQAFPNGVYMIRLLSTQKYLAVENISKANGARLVQWDYANQDNHKFVVTQNRDRATYTIRAKHSGKVLDAYGASTDDGTAVVQWDSSPTADSQQWYILQAGNDYYLMNKAAQKRVRLQGGPTTRTNGTPAELSKAYPEQALGFERFNDEAFGQPSSTTPSMKTRRQPN